jgi:tetratricopeptide (TPR) repeat protein
MALKKYIVIFFTLIVSAYLSLYIVNFDPPDTDSWWHIKTGEYIVKNRNIPKKDIFSYGRTKEIWINPEWLSQVIFYLVYKNFSFDGLLFFKALLGIFISFFIFILANFFTKEYFFSSIFTILSQTVIMYWMQIRPQIFTFLFLILLLFLLYKQKKYYLLFVPILFLIWANFHGGFLAGLFLLTLFTFSQILKIILKKNSKNNIFPILFSTIISYLTPLLNPNFFYVYIHPFYAVRDKFLLTILREWNPPDFSLSSSYTFIFLLSLGIFILIFSYRKIDLTDLLIFLSFTYFSFSARRHFPLFSLVCSPIFAKYSSLCNFKINFSERIKKIFLIILIFISLFFLFLLPERLKFNKNNLIKTCFIYDGVEFIKLNKLSGPIFNDIDWGGYLIFNLYPKEKVAVDTRCDMVYPVSYLKEHMEILEGKNYKDFFEKYKINLILITKDRTLNKFLLRDNDWLLIYPFYKGNLYIRKNLKIPEKLKYPETYTHYLYQGFVLLSKGEIEKSILFLKKSIKLGGREAEIYNNLGYAYVLKGKYIKAIEEFKKAEKIEPDNLYTHLNLAGAYATLGEYENAKKEFRRVLRIDPNNRYAKEALLRLEK